MTLVNFPIFFLLALSVFFSSGFTIISYRARKIIPGGKYLLGIGISVVFWAGGYFVELLLPGLLQKLFWANLKQIGSVLLPLSFLLFTIEYTHFVKKVPKSLIFILLLEPIIVLLCYWMDSIFGVMRLNPHLIQFGLLNHLAFEIGPGLQTHFIYSALVSFAAVNLLLNRLFRAKSFYRNQIVFILLGMSIPFVGALSVFLGIVPAIFDTTPIFLGLSFPIMTWGLLRNEFFTIAPFDPLNMIERIPFGVVVVDQAHEQKILSINPVIEEIFKDRTENILGRPLPAYLPQLDLDQLKGADQCMLELEISDRFYKVHYETISSGNPLRDFGLIVFVDITAQRRLEQSLTSSEAMYRSLIENSIEGIAITQEEKIVFLNQQMADLLGYTIEELAGKPYHQLISEEFLVMQRERTEKRTRGEAVDQFYQGSFLHKNGSKIEVELSSAPITYQAKPAFLVMARDITSRKKLEEERSRSLALLEATIEHSNNGILVVDRNLDVLAHNQRFLKIWGLPLDWQTIKNLDRYHLLDQLVENPEEMQSFLQSIWDQINLEFTKKINLINEHTLELFTRPFFIGGKLIGRIFVFHDITERIKNERRLRASEEKFRFLAENASDVIWLMDLDGKFIYISPSIFSLRGYTAAEAMQQSLEETVTPDSWAEIESIRNKLYEAIEDNSKINGFANRYSFEQLCKDGSTVWTEVKINLVYEEGKIIGIQGVTRDITERKAYEHEIERSRQVAEQRSMELQAALDREQKLHEVTRTISRSMELDTVLSELLRQTLEITGADEAHLGLISEDGLSIHFQYGMDQEHSFSLNEVVPKGKYLAWHAVDQRQGVLINSLEELAQLGVQTLVLSKAPYSSFIVVPLMSGLNVLGVMGVFGKDGSRPFSEHDLLAVEAIGTHAGIALQNARLFEEMNVLAITDPLTRLYNRRYFFNLARLELERAKRYGHDLSIIMMDIDNFKRVNDSYGHLVGDEVLIAVADTIRKTIRSVDLCARYGGEEMVVMLPTTDLQAALISAERLRVEVEKLSVPINSKSVSVTISLGVSSLQHQQELSISKLLDQADQALYDSKQAGKNQVSAWEETTSKD